jgi:hypothetical protein
MRICVAQPPSGRRWRPLQTPPGIAVYLDGRLVKHCVAADDQAGEVWCARLDAAGQIEIDYEQSEIVLERRTGRVRFLRPQAGKGDPDRFPEMLPC